MLPPRSISEIATRRLPSTPIETRCGEVSPVASSASCKAVRIPCQAASARPPRSAYGPAEITGRLDPDSASKARDPSGQTSMTSATPRAHSPPMPQRRAMNRKRYYLPPPTSAKPARAAEKRISEHAEGRMARTPPEPVAEPAEQYASRRRTRPGSRPCATANHLTDLSRRVDYRSEGSSSCSAGRGLPAGTGPSPVHRTSNRAARPSAKGRPARAPGR